MAQDALRADYEVGIFRSIGEYSASNSSPEDRQTALEMNSASRLLSELHSRTNDGQEAFTQQGRARVLSVLHSCLPWLPGGYSGRAHGLMTYLANAPVVSLPLTRAGFITDMRSSLDANTHPRDVVGPVVYRHVDSPRRRKDGEYQYMEASVDVYENVMREFRPTLIHLRSSYPSSLPAALAAKRLKIPMIYEVSGLWELVFEGRGQYGMAARARTLERAVMNAADAVYTLTGAMKRLIESSYLEPGATEVRLAPNAVDLSEMHVKPLPHHSSDHLTLGYVGSLLDYEGIDSLLRAMAVLRDRARPVRAIIVGGGPLAESLRELRDALGLQNMVDFAGGVSSAQAIRYYDLIDVAVIPRHSTPATETVSPLKPFEAMAKGRPIIVSDVKALSEIAEASGAGSVFPAGDANALAAAIEEFVSSPALVESRGLAGREFVESGHTWDIVGQELFGTSVPGRGNVRIRGQK